MENRGQKFNIKKNSYKFNKYKKNYGSVQEGRGLGFLSKNKIKRNYLLKQQDKHKFKTQDREGSSSSQLANQDPYAKYEEDREIFDALPSKKRKLSKLKRAQKEYEDKVKEKEQRRKDKEEMRNEIEKRKQQSKEKRLTRNIKLTQKTRKGQPLMKSRMEILLGDIEKIVSG